jgi:hypothetical protein
MRFVGLRLEKRAAVAVLGKAITKIVTARADGVGPTAIGARPMRTTLREVVRGGWRPWHPPVAVAGDTRHMAPPRVLSSLRYRQQRNLGIVPAVTPGCRRLAGQSARSGLRADGATPPPREPPQPGMGT